MKKSILVSLVVLAATFTSCGSSKPGKVVLNNEVDTVAYTIGMARSNGFVSYLVGQMGVDTTYMKDFIKGFYEGASIGSDPAKQAYIAGLQIGQSEVSSAYDQINENMFGDTDTKMNLDNYLKGFIDGTTHNEDIMAVSDAEPIANRLFTKFMDERIETQYADNKAAGEAYLAAKAKEDGVKATGSGLLYKVITQGRGAVPGPTDRVKVIYKGTLVDGTVFDSTDTPIELRVNGVIKGWTEALQMMPVGSKWELYIPYQLGYGTDENPQSTIKPYSALIFEVELTDIVKN